MNQHLCNLLKTKGKEWHRANNDLLLIGLLFEKHIHFQKINDPLYKEMLTDKLYNLKITNEDYNELLDSLMNMMKNNCSFSTSIAGVLTESDSDEANYFLLDELKIKYLENSKLACSIIKGLHAMKYFPNLELLKEIYKNTNDSELKELTREEIEIQKKYE